MNKLDTIKAADRSIQIKGYHVEPLETIPQDLAIQLQRNARNGKVASTVLSGNGGIIRVINGKLDDTALDIPDKEGMKMPNDNNFDTLFQELKADMREREARTRDEINQREKRFEDTFKSYQQENKEREERFIQLVNEIKNDNRQFKDDIKKDIQNIREDINLTKQDISNLTKHNESLATTNKWSNITTIIGISAIAVAVIIGLLTM